MFAKRTFDIIAATGGLALLLPLMIVAWAAVRATMGRPVLYAPMRTGKHGRLFKLYKFRTMSDDPSLSRTHHSGNDDPRLTGTGRILRRFKIDELPQLWNVLKGEMSIVGPRPETPDYTKLYTQDQMRILSLRPGITDFASIKFANLGAQLTGGDPDKLYFERVWDRKMALRLKYVDERSFWVDLWLVLMTAWSAIAPRKHSQPN